MTPDVEDGIEYNEEQMAPSVGALIAQGRSTGLINLLLKLHIVRSETQAQLVLITIFFISSMVSVWMYKGLIFPKPTTSTYIEDLSEAAKQQLPKSLINQLPSRYGK